MKLILSLFLITLLTLSLVRADEEIVEIVEIEAERIVRETKAVKSSGAVPVVTNIQVIQTLASSWPGGSQYNVKLVNTGSTSLLAAFFTVKGDITQIWAVVPSGTTFGLPAYVTQNGGIAAGASFDFGYITADASPAGFTVMSSTYSGSSASPVAAYPTTVPVVPVVTNPTAAPAVKPTKAPANPTAAPAVPVVVKPTKAPANPTSAPANPTAVPGGGSSVTPATFSGNPFTGAKMFVLPYYAAQVESIALADPSLSGLISKISSVPVAFWLDTMSKVSALGPILAAAQAQQQTSGTPVVVTIVVYDLPARDCAALASNGEIQCEDSTCAAGIRLYETGYINPLIAVLKQYPGVRVAAIVEPDSLPNLVTNLAVPKCTLAQSAYRSCVTYALQQLATLPNVASYLDAAHGGWIGWSTNLAGLSTIFSQVITAAGGNKVVRGFSTNVANYQPLGSLTDTADPCNLAAQWNFAINEVTYTNLLNAALTTAGVTGKSFLIDTSRNGVINARSSCSNWCNIHKAGFGIRPTANPTGLGVNNIDALVWIKPPGESDGTSDSTANRYDAHCGSVDSVTPAPQAGSWFPSYFTMLANNAIPAL